VKSPWYAILAFALVAVVGLSGCVGKKAAKAPLPPPAASESTGTVTPTDYSNSARWLAVPASPGKQADVFYIYPTAYSRETSSDPAICAVDNAGMMTSAQEAYARQAMAFDPSANIYAPYYRQIDANYQLGLSPAQQVANIRREPLVDVQAAFEYYLTNYNQGRPFILVAHSQGSAVAKLLLSGYLKDHPEVYKRMIAAYVVGQSVTPEYLAENPHLKFATGPDDTGVIVSWNTEAESIAATNPVTTPGGIAINPISWTTSEETATANQNLGSIRLNPFNGGRPVMEKNGQERAYMNLADARVDKKRGVVVCSTPNPKHYEFGFPEGVYHTFDYPFYFFNVRANAAQRIQAYLDGNGGS
jgi:hypothetical protein